MSVSLELKSRKIAFQFLELLYQFWVIELSTWFFVLLFLTKKANLLKKNNIQQDMKLLFNLD